MTNEEEIQRYANIIEYYRSQLESIESQFNYLQAAMLDYTKAKMTIEKINETKTGTDILIPLGGGTFTYASAKNTSKILTEIGAGYVLEKSPTDAMELIEKRIQQLTQSQESLSAMSQQIQNQINEISAKAQELMN